MSETEVRAATLAYMHPSVPMGEPPALMMRDMRRALEAAAQARAAAPGPDRGEAERLRAEVERLTRERDDAREDRRALTKALTGLTCNGSEFFVRRGDEYVADIPACLAWIERAKQGVVRGRIDAIRRQKEAEQRADAAEARARGAEAENDKLRAFLANADVPCVYCGLPRAEMARCAHGFPGCGRADDMMADPDPALGPDDDAQLGDPAREGGVDVLSEKSGSVAKRVSSQDDNGLADVLQADPAGAGRAAVRDIALAFDREFGRPARRITVGTAGEDDWRLFVYGETARDLRGLPDTYRGCEVLAQIMGRVRALSPQEQP